MPVRSRVIRNVAAAFLMVGLTLGTVLWQRDDTWPFAQMRMFPGGSESALALTVVVADFTDGRTKRMNPFEFHLKTADIEGQTNRWMANPRMLGDLITAYNSTHARDIVRIHMVRREVHGHLANGQPKWTQRELTRWPA